MVLKMKKQSKKDYSKKWMDRWQIFCMIWISIYNASDIYYNQSINSNNIIALLVTSVVCTIVAYFPKSYFGKKQEELIRIHELQMENEEKENNSMEG